MPQKSEPPPRRGQLVLDRFEPDRDKPRLIIHVLDENGKVLDSVPVDEDGTFPLEATLSERAQRIIIGPSAATPDG